MASPFAGTIDAVAAIMKEACATKDIRLCCAITATILRNIPSEVRTEVLELQPKGLRGHLEVHPCGKAVGEGLRRRRAAARLRRAERARISPESSTTESEDAKETSVKEILLNREGKISQKMSSGACGEQLLCRDPE